MRVGGLVIGREPISEVWEFGRGGREGGARD